jgi:histidyl-tRNA synthetase
MRLLDCKEEQCQELKARAPNFVDHLCEDCHKHFMAVLEYLDELKISYLLNPHLVRGLDYYTRTVFEVFPEEEVNLLNKDMKEKRSSPSALAAGGRYDKLLDTLGGRDTPAIGFAAGMERIIGLMKRNNVKLPQPKKPDVFLVQLGELGRKKSLVLFETLRQSDFLISENLGRESIKSQLKAADRAGVKIALIIGQKEALEDSVILREMTTGVQETVPLHKIVQELKKRLKSIK